MNAEQRAALERLIRVAQQCHGGSRYVSNFLLSWWNAQENGGLDITDLWGLDSDNQADVVTVFAFIATHNVYPDTLGYGEVFGQLVKQWRKPKRRRSPA